MSLGLLCWSVGHVLETEVSQQLNGLPGIFVQTFSEPNGRLCSGCRRIRFVSQTSFLGETVYCYCVSRHHQPICMGCYGKNAQLSFSDYTLCKFFSALPVQRPPPKSASRQFILASVLRLMLSTVTSTAFCSALLSLWI